MKKYDKQTIEAALLIIEFQLLHLAQTEDIWQEEAHFGAKHLREVYEEIEELLKIEAGQ